MSVKVLFSIAVQTFVCRLVCGWLDGSHAQYLYSDKKITLTTCILVKKLVHSLTVCSGILSHQYWIAVRRLPQPLVTNLTIQNKSCFFLQLWFLMLCSSVFCNGQSWTGLPVPLQCRAQSNGGVI